MLIAGLLLARRAWPVPDIFLSYSRTDLAVAGQMAAALQAAGHNVWWDQALTSGEVYDRVTEAALREARVVVVLWSKASVASDWVRSEATVALQRNALMPVMIEDCQRPVMFELRQSADLVGWKGNPKDPRLLAFLAQVARQLGAPASAPATKSPAAPTGPSRRLLIGSAAGAAALAAGGFGAWKFMGGKPFGSGADDGTASVVVLPFNNLSGDPGQAFFSDGIAEELRNALSQIRGLKVIGGVSSERFRDAEDLSVVAAKLGVDHILTGSVRRSPTTIRIGAQLVDGKTGVESWSQSYDQPVGDALAIQSKIATSVVAALSAKLGKAVGEVTVGGTSNPQAQELYLKSTNLFFTEVSDDAIRQAGALLDAAIALDPGYARAWASKAHHISNLRRARSVAEQPAEALAASLRAIALAPDSGFVRMALARQYGDRLDMRRALAEAERGVALAPADGLVLRDFAGTLDDFDPDRSVIMARTAVTLDPLNVRFMITLANCLLHARRFSDVALPLRMAETIGAGQQANRLRVRALLASGQPEAARAALNSMNPDDQKFALEAMLEARAGKRAASDKALANLRENAGGFSSCWLAAVHAQRGETALAIDAIEAALAKRETALKSIAVQPEYDPIRREPRFKAVRDAIIPPDLFVRAKLAPVA